MSEIAYGSVTLATPGIEGAAGTRLPCRQNNQVALGLRAAVPQIFPRGNRTRAIAFSVMRVFGTITERETFEHEHPDELPAQDDLVFTHPDATTHTYADAALEAVEFTPLGLSCRVDYTFVAAAVT